MSYEYTVIPAPSRSEKAKDAKTPTDRFALAVTAELNRMARDGWEYLRADVLPSEERSGLTGRATIYHNLLVFRRPLARPATGIAEQPATAAQAQDPAPPQAAEATDGAAARAVPAEG